MTVIPIHKEIISVPAVLDNLAEIRNFVRCGALNAGIESEKRINNCMLAVDESCTNLMRHSLHPIDLITITSMSDNNVFELDISDSGKPFNPLFYQTPDLNQYMKHFCKGGLGIFIIRKLTDEIEYFSDNGINTLKLIWKI